MRLPVFRDGSSIGPDGIALLAEGPPQVWPHNGNRVPNRFRVSALEFRPLAIRGLPLCAQALAHGSVSQVGSRSRLAARDQPAALFRLIGTLAAPPPNPTSVLDLYLLKGRRGRGNVGVAPGTFKLVLPFCSTKCGLGWPQPDTGDFLTPQPVLIPLDSKITAPVDCVLLVSLTGPSSLAAHFSLPAQVLVSLGSLSVVPSSHCRQAGGLALGAATLLMGSADPLQELLLLFSQASSSIRTPPPFPLPPSFPQCSPFGPQPGQWPWDFVCTGFSPPLPCRGGIRVSR